jgi:hypothetical protein
MNGQYILDYYHEEKIRDIEPEYPNIEVNCMVRRTILEYYQLLTASMGYFANLSVGYMDLLHKM